MAKYFPKDQLNWEDATVLGGTVMSKSIVWEGDFGVRSGFFLMPKGMSVPMHTHPKWVQVMVLEGVMEVETEEDGKTVISAGDCYFVEPGDSHIETAIEDSRVIVTQAEDRLAFLQESE